MFLMEQEAPSSLHGADNEKGIKKVCYNPTFTVSIAYLGRRTFETIN
jgi:hypothetical protein